MAEILLRDLRARITQEIYQNGSQLTLVWEGSCYDFVRSRYAEEFKQATAFSDLEIGEIESAIGHTVAVDDLFHIEAKLDITTRTLLYISVTEEEGNPSQFNGSDIVPVIDVPRPLTVAPAKEPQRASLTEEELKALQVEVKDKIDKFYKSIRDHSQSCRFEADADTNYHRHTWGLRCLVCGWSASLDTIDIKFAVQFGLLPQNFNARMLILKIRAAYLLSLAKQEHTVTYRILSGSGFELATVTQQKHFVFMQSGGRYRLKVDKLTDYQQRSLSDFCARKLKAGSRPMLEFLVYSAIDSDNNPLCSKIDIVVSTTKEVTGEQVEKEPAKEREAGPDSQSDCESEGE